ncbi:hypothetical protein BJV82DRAFT_514032 [Fennellomyces sp. T-0311]|nr:hypothetical protein BJV82DRAFT_514032 [Fennellomyces sp. T-0311]
MSSLAPLSTSSYVTYQRGDLPLILTVPHGGRMDADEIPERTKTGDAVLVNDALTIDTAHAIAEKVTAYYGSQPYMVICNVRRSKVDMNRPIESAADSPQGRAVWKEFHHTLRHAVNEIRARHHQEGLLLDIHGNHSLLVTQQYLIHHALGHRRHEFVMLGYLMEKDELIELANDPQGTDQAVLEKSSIQSLAKRVTLSPHELLRGEGSFGELMSLQSSNVQTIPSPSHPAPNAEDRFYSGAYITESYHTNATQAGLDAVQIELPQHLRFTESGRQTTAKAVSEAVIYWLDHHYQPVVLQTKALL